MNLNIIIEPESEQFFREQAASLGEDVSLVAGKWVDQNVRIQRQTQPTAANSNLSPVNIEERTKLAHALLEQCRLRQPIVPLPDDPPGISDRWPEGESVEDFLQAIREVNEASVPRVFP